MDNQRLRSLCAKCADAITRAVDEFEGKEGKDVAWIYVADQLAFAYSWLSRAFETAESQGRLSLNLAPRPPSPPESEVDTAIYEPTPEALYAERDALRPVVDDADPAMRWDDRRGWVPKPPIGGVSHFDS